MFVTHGSLGTGLRPVGGQGQLLQAALHWQHPLLFFDRCCPDLRPQSPNTCVCRSARAALVAVHAPLLERHHPAPARPVQPRAAIRRPRGHRHVVYLDELTYGLAVEGIRERLLLWPMSSSPHLIVNRFTAMTTDAPPPGSPPTRPVSSDFSGSAGPPRSGTSTLPTPNAPTGLCVEDGGAVSLPQPHRRRQPARRE